MPVEVLNPGLQELLLAEILLEGQALDLATLEIGLEAGGGGFAGTLGGLFRSHGCGTGRLLAGFDLAQGGGVRGVFTGGDLLPCLGMAGEGKQREEAKEERFHGVRFSMLACSLRNSARTCLNVRRISCISASSNPFFEVK
mgnify:CR=1 FL=1